MEGFQMLSYFVSKDYLIILLLINSSISIFFDVDCVEIWLDESLGLKEIVGLLLATILIFK